MPRLAYLRLLRASAALFKRDAFALKSARAELRSHFEAHRAERDSRRVAALLADAKDALDFMQNNLVQATRTQRGTYAVELKPGVQGNEFAPKHPSDVMPYADEPRRCDDCDLPNVTKH